MMELEWEEQSTRTVKCLKATMIGRIPPRRHFALNKVIDQELNDMGIDSKSYRLQSLGSVGLVYFHEQEDYSIAKMILF